MLLATLNILVSQKVFIKSFCKSQFPHKSVNFIFILVIIKDDLANLCGCLLPNNFINTICDINSRWMSDEVADRRDCARGLIHSGLVGSTWERYHERRRCSRNTYPGSYISKHTSIRRIMAQHPPWWTTDRSRPPECGGLVIKFAPETGEIERDPC